MIKNKKMKDYQKEYRKNITNEQKQKYKIIKTNVEKILLTSKNKK